MKGSVILVTRPGLGSTSTDDAAFGIDMLDKFFHSLESLAEKPKAICFYTDGVKVLAKGSTLELSLRLLEGLGIDLVACQTCVEYYGVEYDLVAGRLSTMAEIVRLIGAAEKVVTI